MPKAYDTGEPVKHKKETARRKIMEHLRKRQTRILNKPCAAVEPFEQGLYLFPFGFEDKDNKFKPQVCEAFFSMLQKLVEEWLDKEYPKEGLTEKQIREKLTSLMIKAYERIGRKPMIWFLSPYDGFFRLVGENHDRNG